MPTWSGCGRGDEVSPPMRVLVTGADGFVGRRLVPRLIETGHGVTAACRPAAEPQSWMDHRWRKAVRVIPFELTDPAGVREVFSSPYDAIVHLAAVASVREAREDPGRAWVVNAAGTARLGDAVISSRRAGGTDPVVLIISSAEVYGSGPPSPR